MKSQTRIQDPNITIEQILLGSEQVLIRLRTLAASLGPHARAEQFYTRARAKTSDSVIQKVNIRRYSIQKRDYSFRDITDYVGFRIVTLYDDQLPDAIDHVLNIVRTGSSINEPLFSDASIWDAFHDAKFSARTREKYDDKVPEEKQTDVYYACFSRLLNAVDKSKEKNKRKLRTLIMASCEAHPRKDNLRKENEEDNWYSSAHLTFWAIAYFDKSIKIPIPVEFQLRTAVEDVWAEINHKLLYKSENRFVWSVDYQNAISGAKNASKKLKNRIESLPDQIEIFRDFSNTSLHISTNYWGDNSNLRRSRKSNTATPLSLCAALIYRVDSGNAPMEVSRVLERYDQNMISISEDNLTPNEVAEHLWLRIQPLQNLATDIRPLGRDPSKYDKIEMLNYQRANLLEIEILKIETLIFLNSNHQVSRDRSNVIVVEDNEKVAIHLYERFCNFIDDKHMLVRPMTMMFTWKYMLADRFNKKLAAENIFTALSYLKTDATLPSWSVYKVIVPSCIATALYEEAKSLHNSILLCGIAPASMSNLSMSTKDKLRDALRFALQAFEEHTDKSKEHIERRGDIGFLPRRYVPIREAETVMAIVLEFKRQFSMYVGTYSAVIGSRVFAAYEYIAHNRELYQNGDLSSEIYLIDEGKRARFLNEIDQFSALCIN